MKEVENIFFSGTFGGETLSLAAAKSALSKLRHEPVIETLQKRGQEIMNGVVSIINKFELGNVISICGHPSWSFLQFRSSQPFSNWEIKTLFIQEVFRRGVYTLGTHNISYAHTEADVTTLLNCYEEVFKLIASALADGDLRKCLECEPLVPLFKVR